MFELPKKERLILKNNLKLESSNLNEKIKNFLEYKKHKEDSANLPIKHERLGV